MSKTNPTKSNTSPRKGEGKAAEEVFVVHPIALHTMTASPEESAKAKKQLAEREAKWKGVTVGEMFGRLCGECEALADMMEEVRCRLWKTQLKEWKAGERNSAALSYFNALDQSARCLVDQLEAVATFGREVFGMEAVRTGCPTIPDTAPTSKAKAKPWKVCGNHVEVEPCVLTQDDVRKMLCALPGGKDAALQKLKEAASKPAKAPTPQGKANTSPTSGKPSKGQQKGKPRA